MLYHGALFVLLLHGKAMHKQLTINALIDNAYTQGKPLISLNCSLAETAAGTVWESSLD